MRQHSVEQTGYDNYGKRQTMSKSTAYRTIKQQIQRETDAEIAFGRFLEQSGGL